ncbi:class-II fumarase/aspartase family protein [Capillimicrobium parvum]|uniref:class-II fumarase/aspartase family protein n=1 Tax=Capillimicrobium parvum TaxID=2884022 RepID=UPI00216AD72B|nr:adenylosuccinate lyase family protein [Capillimicrobium parvum]
MSCRPADGLRAPFNLLTELFGDPVMAGVFAEEQAVRGWLRAEAALAQAQGDAGVVDDDIAREVARACVIENVDFDVLWRDARNVGYPILPLVRMIDDALSDRAAGHMHLGATTQDIMDTGLALQLAEATDRLIVLTGTVGDALADIVDVHRRTYMAARTHGQQAVPTTFGAKVAVHLAEFTRRRERLVAVRPMIACVSLFGAGGTSAALGPSAPRVRQRMGQILALEVTDVPWHVARDRLAEFGLACSTLAASCSRFAREVVALSRTEIGEVSEPRGHHRGASSTMPQKSNPIASEAIIGMSLTAAALSSALHVAMEAGHERAAGEWQVEWVVLPALAVMAAGCALNAAEIASGLEVYPSTMRRNMQTGQGFVMAEAYMMRLAGHMGRERAHDRMYAAVLEARGRGESLDAVLAGMSDSDPPFELIPLEDYVGDPDLVCDTALRAWRAGTRSATSIERTAI